MLYSHSFETDQFNYFISFINHIMEGEDKYKGSVIPVLEQTHQLAMGERDPYSIDRDAFSIIVYLLDRDKEFFERLDAEKVTKEELEYVKEIMLDSKGHLVL